VQYLLVYGENYIMIMTNNRWYKSLIIFILAGILGLFSLTIPTLLTSGVKPYEVISGNGIVSVIHLDDKIIGVGTNWETYTEPGMDIIIDGIQYKIREVNDNNMITLMTPYVRETSKAKSYSFVYPRFFPLIDEARDHLYSFREIITLFLIGLIFGYLWPKHKGLWGFGVVSLFPIFSIAEMIKNTYSHNLWPIEFILYGFATIPGIVGAYIGAFIRKKFTETIAKLKWRKDKIYK